MEVIINSFDGEKQGTIRHGARMMFSIYQASVPWCSIILRRVFGVAGAQDIWNQTLISESVPVFLYNLKQRPRSTGIKFDFPLIPIEFDYRNLNIKKLFDDFYIGFRMPGW